MLNLVYLGFFILIILSFLGKRWAYIATIVLGIIFFFARANFQLNPKACQVIFDIPLALYSLTNYKHVFMFGVFFLMTRRQILKKGIAGYGWAVLATLAFGLAVELLEGVTGKGNCRMRDLVPDFAGTIWGQIVYLAGSYLVPIIKKRVTKLQ
jgi:hypothetical protein